MSNIVAHQYETLFKENQWEMVLPKTIARRYIDNKETIALILKFEGRHDSEEFKREFLTTTVNGKSTVRVAEDFGLVINRLEVDFGNDYALSRLYENPERVLRDYKFFTVICHVSPAARERVRAVKWINYVLIAGAVTAVYDVRLRRAKNS